MRRRSKQPRPFAVLIPVLAAATAVTGCAFEQKQVEEQLASPGGDRLPDRAR